MKTYKWINEANGIVAVIDEDGISRTSGLASSLVPAGAEIAEADPPPSPTVQEQISAIEAQFTDTLKMRAIIGDATAVQTVTGMLANIDALKAQLP